MDSLSGGPTLATPRREAEGDGDFSEPRQKNGKNPPYPTN